MCDAEAPKAPRARAVTLGIGDDAAAWQPSRSHRAIITTDALVEGVHFLSSAVDPRDIGHRAMAANLSDVAAMGARPVLATVALGLGARPSEAWVLEAYRGMVGLAARHGTRIVGGDLSRSAGLFLAVTLVGEVSPRRLKRRDAGRPGDTLALTGPLGASRAGLELLRRDLSVSDAARAAALSAFHTPVPRVEEGRWLAASTAVHALMDCSDGLSSDLPRLARASAVAAVVERVPVHPAAASVAEAAGADSCEWALSGGEDFELIVALAPRAFPFVARRFAARFGRPLEPLGRLESGSGVFVEESGKPARPLTAAGWDHLAG